MTDEEAYEYLHDCRFCSSFTGDDSTGCKGNLENGGYKACCHFDLDLITSPRWARDYRHLFEPEW